MGNDLCKQCLTNDQHTAKSIKVLTLNYGGVLNNPFQFYSEDQTEEKRLSQTFCSLLATYSLRSSGKEFQWNIGKIDLKFQAQRYSPLYNPKVGIDQKKNKFVKSQEFRKNWDQYYSIAHNKKKIDPQPKKEQIQTMKMFDLISYHAILVQLYGISSKQTLEKIDLSKLDIKKYQEYMKMKFSKSFLNEEEKLNKVFKMLEKIEVAFIQQTTQKLIERVKNDKRFLVKEKGSGNSMIVVRKDAFENQESILKPQQLKQLQKKDALKFKDNDDVVYLCFNKTILISTHLASKKEKNAAQVAAMGTFLNNLIKTYSGCHVILGADANSYVSQKDFNTKYSIYPSNQKTVTTRKKRTFLQPQFKKADQVVKQCKDHIITTLKIVGHSVATIDMKDVTEEIFLPSDKHPFDHFMVGCQLIFEQKRL